MANRYWVGGTATWDATAGTKWSTTSGGAGGSAVPTSVDDVFFDAASGAVTVTFTTGRNMKSVNFTGFTGTFASAGFTFNMNNGDATFVAGMTLTGSAGLNVLSGTTNLTSAGKTFGSITLTTGALTLQDALTMTGTLTVTAGTLTTNNHAVATGSFSSANTNTRTLTLGSSAISVSGTATNTWNTGTTTGLTVTANTAVVTFTGTASATLFAGSSFNYNGMSIVWTGNGSSGFQFGTIANFTYNGNTSKTNQLFLPTGTITGTLTVAGATNVARILIASISGMGQQRTVTAAALALSNVDLQDINGAGVASWDLSAITGLSGDAGGNSNITFTTATTLYKVAGGGGFTAWDVASSWSLSSGGATGGGARVPLSQDDVYLDGNSNSASANMPRLGKNIDCTGYTSTLTANVLSVGNFGSLTLSTGMTFTGGGSQNWNFDGRGTHEVTFAGKTFSNQPQFRVGTYTLNDNLITTSSSNFNIGVSAGTSAVLNAQNVTWAGGLVTINPNATLNMQNSTCQLTRTSAGGVWGVGANAVINAAGSTIELIFASTNARSFSGAGYRYGTIKYTVANSPGALTITGNNTFEAMNIGAGRQVTLPASGTQNVGSLTASGEDRDHLLMPGTASAGAVVTTIGTGLLIDTGVLELIADIQPTSYRTGQTLISKWQDGQTGTLWYMSITSAGLIAFRTRHVASSTDQIISATGTAIPNDGARRLIKVRYQRDTGSGNYSRRYFHTTDLDPFTATWTEMGTERTGTSLAATTNDTSVLGFSAVNATGSFEPFLGKFHKAWIIKDGVTVASPNYTTHVTGSNSLVDAQGVTWTPNGVAFNYDGRLALVSSTGGTPTYLAGTLTEDTGKPVYFFGDARTGEDGLPLGYATFDGGSGNYVWSPDHNDLDIAGDMELMSRVRLTDYSPAAVQALIVKDDFVTAGILQYTLYINTTGNLLWAHSPNNSTISTIQQALSGVSDDTEQWFKSTYRLSDRRVQLFKSPDGDTWTQVGVNGTSPSSGTGNTTARLKIGNASAFYVGRLTGRVYRTAVRSGIESNAVAVFDADFTEVPPVYDLDYLRIQDVRATGHGLWFAGANSIDVSGNDYWTFTSPSTLKNILTLGVG